MLAVQISSSSSSNFQSSDESQKSFSHPSPCRGGSTLMAIDSHPSAFSQLGSESSTLLTIWEKACPAINVSLTGTSRPNHGPFGILPNPLIINSPTIVSLPNAPTTYQTTNLIPINHPRGQVLNQDFSFHNNQTNYADAAGLFLSSSQNLGISPLGDQGAGPSNLGSNHSFAPPGQLHSIAPQGPNFAALLSVATGGNLSCSVSPQQSSNPGSRGSSSPSSSQLQAPLMISTSTAQLDPTPVGHMADIPSTLAFAIGSNDVPPRRPPQKKNQSTPSSGFKRQLATKLGLPILLAMILPLFFSESNPIVPPFLRLGNTRLFLGFRIGLSRLIRPLSRLGRLRALPPSLTHVSTLLLPNGDWNIPLLRASFQQDTVNDILSLPPPDPSKPDTYFWQHSTSGHYSVRTGYHVAKQAINRVQPSSSNTETLTRWWKSLWRLPIPPKIRHFVYRLAQHSLPTTNNLYNRHCISSPICPKCSLCFESVQHALFECQEMKKAWSDEFNLFLCMLWKCWNARNASVFRNQVSRPETIEQEAQDYLAFYQAAQDKRWNHSQSTSDRDLLVWEPPPVGFLKLNTDAAISSHQNRTGGGALVRDHTGKIIAATAFNRIGQLHPQAAEGWALLEALKWCQDKGININHVEVDCKNLLTELQTSSENLTSFGNIINAIRRLLSSFPTVTLHHTRRQGNTAAHNLAQMSIGLDNTWSWNSQDPYPFPL
ncbi:hypothetical protein G4B88_028423 [Cannabis sativa]|uniref:RNase H type-1 domain-containing protein n=1 Tax=Cannabis sativa TaxID=3483 RepID=A0A7J6F0S9_CANSA|nr:hypothetical protein G4B88_028423 [Cannabis sativa]